MIELEKPLLYYILDANKNIVAATDLKKWSEWFENSPDRLLKQEYIKDGDQEYFVSTVFLGIDHSYVGGTPILFETMVFESGSMSELYMQQYTAYDDAMRGHGAIMSVLRENGVEGLPDDIEDVANPCTEVEFQIDAACDGPDAWKPGTHYKWGLPGVEDDK